MDRVWPFTTGLLCMGFRLIIKLFFKIIRRLKVSIVISQIGNYFEYCVDYRSERMKFDTENNLRIGKQLMM